MGLLLTLRTPSQSYFTLALELTMVEVNAAGVAFTVGSFCLALFCRTSGRAVLQSPGPPWVPAQRRLSSKFLRCGERL